MEAEQIGRAKAKKNEVNQDNRDDGVLGRGGDLVKPRKYHMSDSELNELKSRAAATGGFVNPYGRRVGAYYFQVQALCDLGVNKYHRDYEVLAKIRELMESYPKTVTINGVKSDSNAWVEFEGRPSRANARNALDPKQRISQNYRVLQRIPKKGSKENNHYGMKLSQLCMAIGIIREPNPEFAEVPIEYFCLHTGFSSPEESIPVYENKFARKRGRKPGSGKRGKRGKVGIKEVSENPESVESPVEESAEFVETPESVDMESGDSAHSRAVSNDINDSSENLEWYIDENGEKQYTETESDSG